MTAIRAGNVAIAFSSRSVLVFSHFFASHKIHCARRRRLIDITTSIVSDSPIAILTHHKIYAALPPSSHETSLVSRASIRFWYSFAANSLRWCATWSQCSSGCNYITWFLVIRALRTNLKNSIITPLEYIDISHKDENRSVTFVGISSDHFFFNAALT